MEIVKRVLNGFPAKGWRLDTWDQATHAFAKAISNATLADEINERRDPIRRSVPLRHEIYGRHTASQRIIQCFDQLKKLDLMTAFNESKVRTAIGFGIDGNLGVSLAAMCSINKNVWALQPNNEPCKEKAKTTALRTRIATLISYPGKILDTAALKPMPKLFAFIYDCATRGLLTSAPDKHCSFLHQEDDEDEEYLFKPTVDSEDSDMESVPRDWHAQTVSLWQARGKWSTIQVLEKEIKVPSIRFKVFENGPPEKVFIRVILTHRPHDQSKLDEIVCNIDSEGVVTFATTQFHNACDGTIPAFLECTENHPELTFHAVQRSFHLCVLCRASRKHLAKCPLRSKNGVKRTHRDRPQRITRSITKKMQEKTPPSSPSSEDEHVHKRRKITLAEISFPLRHVIRKSD